ncbi:ATP-binding protein [Bacillus sp. Marseille-P3661]|uniref:ATP-binding protein n=1 Tax=Bacillus sp. Marseille-P3661 TaxID=1936234 RepID=UPI000C81F87C|nr:ATP-binding protein [Bacillus sp. Marseille-P3661]
MKTEPWYIINSKYNCEHYYGIDPLSSPEHVTVLNKQDLKHRQDMYSDLINLTEYFVKKLFFFLNDIPAIVLISDDECNILNVIGSNDIKEQIGIKEGFSFDEKYAGTNSIFLCLHHNQPIQVKGTDHFHHVLYNFSCSSCKFILGNGLTGTITLMTSLEEAASFHLGLVSSAVDSIEREIELRKKNKQLDLFNQILINSTKNGIIITDQEGYITDFNKVAEDYTSLKCDEVIGKKINNFEGFSKYFEEVLTQGKKFENIEVHFFEDSKINKVCLFDALPIYDEDQMIGAFGQFRDITDRFELEQQIIANEKLSVIGKLSAGLAHEIRNPLTPISGFLQLLETNLADQKTKEYFNIIRTELERINELINNFVMVSKPEAPSRKQIYVQDLIVETILFMESQANLHNISISFFDDISEKLPIFIDKNQIKQVLINLIQNSIEEMSNGGVIKILLNKSQSTNMIEISVVDQGKGIDSETLKNLFTPFFTTKNTGTGLGLSVCQRIIQNHNGLINVETQKDVGTTFKIKLPIIAQNK